MCRMLPKVSTDDTEVENTYQISAYGSKGKKRWCLSVQNIVIQELPTILGSKGTSNFF